MSFFGLFGKNDPETNCECHKNLKEHLSKCADYGKRPPLLEKGQCPPIPKECKKQEEKDECGHDKSEGRVYLKPFIPDVKIPPTATFKCPEGTCVEKPKSCECPPPPPPPPASGGGCCGGGGSSKGSGSGSGGSSRKGGKDSDAANSCEPPPLKW